MKYMKDFTAHFGKRTVFSIRDVKNFLWQKGISAQYLSLLIHNLVKKGTIKKISGGIYTFHEDMLVSGFAFSPFYYGLHEALSLHGLWGQQTNPVILTAKKARAGVRTIFSNNIYVRRISKNMFFGIEMLKYADFWIPVSCIEKTAIDFAYFREKIPEEAKQVMLERMDKRKLSMFIKEVPKNSRQRVKERIYEKEFRELMD